MKSDERIARQVGAALRRIRQERNARQIRVAELAGITRCMLSRYEHGHQCPTLPTLTKLLMVLNVTAEDFGRYVGPWGCLS